MYPLIETICIKNGVVQNLEYHQKRVEKSIRELSPKICCFQLIDLIENNPTQLKNTVRCRIEYTDISTKIDYLQYQPRKIERLKLIFSDQIDYHLKFANRSELDKLTMLKEDCDEILIVKKGWLTDTSFTNIVFCKDNRFVTPKYPLLCGTRRQYLIDKGILQEQEIAYNDLKKFESVILINAMLDLNIERKINIKNIVI